jgi:N-acetylglucosamine-6-phosphate deacetylase
MTHSYEVLEKAFDAVRVLKKRQKEDEGFGSASAEILGVHAEGPFISFAKKGAQNGDYIRPLDADFVIKHSDIMRLVTVAPELDAGFENIKKIKKETDVVVSIGHTDADYDTVMGAIEAGATHGTHLFNAMSVATHRAPNTAGALLFSDKVSCELICDGVHVHPAWFKPVATLKGAKLNLITDCLTACGLPDGRYDIGGQTFDLKGVECRLSDGTIAGSVIKLNKAVYNLWKSGIELHEAVNAASLYPAETLGLGSERGALRVGYVADAVICDGELNVLSVIHG